MGFTITNLPLTTVIVIKLGVPGFEVLHVLRRNNSARVRVVIDFQNSRVTSRFPSLNLYDTVEKSIDTWMKLRK